MDQGDQRGSKRCRPASKSFHTLNNNNIQRDRQGSYMTVSLNADDAEAYSVHSLRVAIAKQERWEGAASAIQIFHSGPDGTKGDLINGAELPADTTYFVFQLPFRPIIAYKHDPKDDNAANDTSMVVRVHEDEAELQRGKFHVRGLRDAIAKYTMFLGDPSTINIYHRRKDGTKGKLVKEGELPADTAHFVFELRAPVRQAWGRLQGYCGNDVDPIDFLASARQSTDPGVWFLAHPKFGAEPPKTVNLADLHARFNPLVDDIKMQMPQFGDAKGAKLLVVQAGKGMGKSHVVDIAGDLVFPGEEPLVLKVSYSFTQDLQYEANIAAGEGLLARLVLALHATVRPDACDVVEEALRLRKTLTAQAVAKHVLADSRAAGRNIVVAVDSIGSLSGYSVRGLDCVRSVKAAVATFMVEVFEQTNGNQMAIGLITAFPNLDFASLPGTGRPVAIAVPAALPEAESVKLLTELTPDTNAEHLQEMVLMCGGHARSLAVAAKLYSQSGEVPTAVSVSGECHWPVTQGSTNSKIVEAVKEAYMLGDSELGLNMRKLDVIAMVTHRSDHYVIPPTVFFCDQDADDTNSELSALQSMFQPLNEDVHAATKALEYTNYHWDAFRAAQQLPVVPPSLVKSLSAPTAADFFAFDSMKPKIEKTILRQGGGVDNDFTLIDDTAYYLPPLPNHRAIESMCVAKSVDGKTKTLVLFQSKIDTGLLPAISNMNVASKELCDAELWKGEFLFIIFSLTSVCDADLSNADHPTLLVNRERTTNYFTASLAPAALLSLH